MKKWLIIIFLLVFTLPPVLSAVQSVHDGRLYDNEPKDVNGIQLKVSSSFNKASITYGTHKFVVSMNKCTNDGYYEACLRKTEQDLFSEFSLIPKGLDISFTKTKEPDSSTFAVLDPVVIKLQIKNNGDMPLSFSVIDNAVDLEITRIDNICYQDGSNIVFNYSVRGKDTVECSYRARILKPGKSSRKAIMSYFDGTTTKTLESSVSLKAEDYGFKIDFITDKASYELGDKAAVTLRFSNTFKQPVKVEYVDFTPAGLFVIEQPSRFSNAGRYYQLRGIDLEAETSSDFIFYINVTQIKNEIIIKSRAFTPQGFKDELAKKTIEVASIKPDVTLQRLGDHQFKVHIQNINKNRPIKNLKIDLKSNYQNLVLSRTFSEIPANGKVIMDVTLRPFETRPTIVYPFFATGTYETELGESFPFSKTMQIDLRQQLNSPPPVIEPETPAQQQNETNETTKGPGFFKSLIQKITNLFSKSNETTKEQVEINKTEEQVVNKTSKLKSLASKLAFLKPTKQKLVVVGVIVVIILLILLLIFLVKKHKKVQHIEVKLQDVKL